MTGEKKDIRPEFDEAIITEEIVGDYNVSLDDIFAQFDNGEINEAQLSELSDKVLSDLIDEYILFDLSLSADEKNALHTYLEFKGDLTESEAALKSRLEDWQSIHEAREQALEGEEILIVNNPLEKHSHDKLAFVGSSTIARINYMTRNHYNPDLAPQYSEESGGSGFSKSGRHLIPTIENKAMEVIAMNTYETLVLNGASNDIYACKEKDVPEMAEKIITAFTKIIEAAHRVEDDKNPMQVILVSIYKRSGRSEGRDRAVDMINDWIRHRSGVDAVIDTNALSEDQIAEDGYHPSRKGAIDMYKAIEEVAIDEHEPMFIRKRPLEKCEPEELMLIGDSVMQYTTYGMTRHTSEEYRTRFPSYVADDTTKIGRMLVPHEGQNKDTDYLEDHSGEGINIETKALGIIDRANNNDDLPRVKTIVLDGGFNDIYSYRTLGKNKEITAFTVADEIIESYKRIIAAADEKGIQIVLYTILRHRGFSDDDPRNQAIAYVNDWIRDEAQTHAVIDADMLTGKEMAGDKFHPSYRPGKDKKQRDKDSGVKKLGQAIEKLTLK